MAEHRLHCYRVTLSDHETFDIECFSVNTVQGGALAFWNGGTDLVPFKILAPGAWLEVTRLSIADARPEMTGKEQR